MKLTLVALLMFVCASFAGLTLDYVDSDFGHGCQYYTYTNDLASAKSVSAPLAEISATGKFKPSDVTNGAWEILTEVEHTRQVWVTDIVCSNQSINGTKQQVCNDKGSFKSETYMSNDWLPFKSEKSLAKGKTKVRYCASYPMKEGTDGWSFQADVIPTFDGVRYPEYAWWNATWQYRAPCYVNTTVASSLADFPVYCVVDTSALIAVGKMNTSCQDLRIVNASETALSYEIENGTCNTTATIIWARIPATNASGNTTLYAYYKADGVSDGQNASGVWIPGNYASVYHFGSNATLIDSTGHNNLANDTATCIYRNNLTALGGEIDFKNNCYYHKNSPINLATGTGNSSETVFMRSGGLTAGNSWDAIYDYGTASSGNARGLVLKSGTFADYRYDTYSNTWGSGIAVDITNTFDKMNLNWNGTNTTFTFKNSSLSTKATGTVTISNTGSTFLYVGATGWSSATQKITNATISEVRLSNVSRTADWINAEINQTYAMGAEEAAVSDIAPSIINVTLAPATPYTEDNLNCSFYAEDNDSSTLNISALWIKNGVNVLNSTSSGQSANATYSFLLLAGNTSTGENWSCTGYAIDNTSLSGTASSSNVTIRNDAPTISSMTLIPAVAYKIDTLTCSAIISDNNTALVNATFRWYEDGALQDTNGYSGTANTTYQDTSAGPHTQATTWICSLDAYDGDTHTYQNASVVISNHAPTISLGLLPSDPTDTSTMTCSITAGDSDNDTLSGVIEWYINGTTLVNSSSWSGSPGSYSGTLTGLFTYGDNISCFANATDSFDVISGWSVNRTVRNTTGYSTNFTFSRNYTFTDYETYITGFYDDWIGYILSLVAMAVSFILGKSYSQIFLMSGVGLFAVFILTGTAVILAGAVLLIIMSMLIKYVTGV